jgi:hypothetical protein
MEAARSLVHQRAELVEHIACRSFLAESSVDLEAPNDIPIGLACLKGRRIHQTHYMRTALATSLKVVGHARPTPAQHPNPQGTFADCVAGTTALG